jgi:hypothetical protein
MQPFELDVMDPGVVTTECCCCCGLLSGSGSGAPKIAA